MHFFRTGDHRQFSERAMQFTIRDLFGVIAGVAVVLLSEKGFAVFSRTVDTAHFESYPVTVPVLAILQFAVATIPWGGKESQPSSYTGVCKWTFALFFMLSLGFAYALLRRWEVSGPMAGMANSINLVNTAIIQLAVALFTLVALRASGAHKLHLIAVLSLSSVYCGGVLFMHLRG